MTFESELHTRLAAELATANTPEEITAAMIRAVALDIEDTVSRPDTLLDFHKTLRRIQAAALKALLANRSMTAVNEAVSYCAFDCVLRCMFYALPEAVEETGEGALFLSLRRAWIDKFHANVCEALRHLKAQNVKRHGTAPSATAH